MSQLFIYAKSNKGVEQTELVDAYEVRPDGGVDLYRGCVEGPFATLEPDQMAQGFIVLEWDAELSEFYSADMEIDFEEDEDGDVYVNVTLPTQH